MTDYIKKELEKLKNRIREIEDFDATLTSIKELKATTSNEETKKSCDIVCEKLQFEIDIRCASFGIPTSKPPSCYRQHATYSITGKCQVCEWCTSCLTYSPIKCCCDTEGRYL